MKHPIYRVLQGNRQNIEFGSNPDGCTTSITKTTENDNLKYLLGLVQYPIFA